jgi:uncharacterized protein
MRRFLFLFAISLCLARPLSWCRAADSAILQEAEADYARQLLQKLDRSATGGSDSKPLVIKAAAALKEARVELERHPAALHAAVRAIEQAAEQGDPTGQYLMGCVKEEELPFEGQSTVRGDLVAAVELYKKAAAQNCVAAMNKMAEFNYYGTLGRHDLEAAARWWQQAAEAGSVDAMVALGGLYQVNTPERGTQLAPQYEKALEWYGRAAGKGNAEAMFQLARQYHFGWGTEKNESISALWLKRAEQSGHNLASLIRRGVIGFPSGWGANADLDDARQSRTSREAQSEPAKGNPASIDELRMAVNSGSFEARLLLGEAYEFGRGVPQDLKEALTQYQQVAHFIDGARPRWISIKASEAIVRICASGQLKRDLPAMPFGIKDADQLPSPAVRFQLAELYWRGNAAVKANPTNAVTWYLEAARAGSAPAMRRLGELWRDGVNGSPDPEEAQRWFQRAAETEKSTP